MTDLQDATMQQGKQEEQPDELKEPLKQKDTETHCLSDNDRNHLRFKHLLLGL